MDPSTQQAPNLENKGGHRFDPNFTDAVINAMGPAVPDRTRFVMGKLIRHLHDFIREVELTNDEWFEGVRFVNSIGKTTTNTRNEAHRISDVLGVESLVDEIAHMHINESGETPTSSTILGPFWSPHSPFRPLGDTIVRSPHPDGQVTLMHGKVIDLDTKKGIPNAVIDIWQASANGKYDFQDPENQEPNNLRGKFTTNENGEYWYYCYKPTSYSLPTDGAAGQLFKTLDRHPFRPAHIHLMVSADNYKPLITQLYPRDDKYVTNDTVFAVKDDLLLDFEPSKDPKAKLDLTYNVTLAPSGKKSSRLEALTSSTVPKMRVPYAPSEPPNEEARPIYERIAERRKPRPLIPLDLALLHNPAMADGWNSFIGAIRTKTSLPDTLKELAISRVAVHNHAVHEWDIHAALALKAGVSKQVMQAVFDQPVTKHGMVAKEVPAGFTSEEYAVMVYTDQMTVGVQVEDEVFEMVKRVLSDTMVVELTATIAAYNTVSRFLVALDVGDIRQSRIRPALITTAQRYASTKHPQNFTPPTQSDLDELRESVREFARREIPEEVAAQTDRQNAFPNEMWQKFGEAGFLGITADEEFGGLGMGYQAHCVVMEELSRASGSIGLSYAAHSQLCVNQLMLNGNAEQKKKYLPGLISGEHIGALAMSEHGAGSDVVSMRMAAKEVDGGYLLNGTKMWITNGPDAHTIVVYAKTIPDGASKGITAFIVETSSKGFSVANKLDKLGMRGSNTGELVFEDVFVPKENVLGEVNRGVRVLMEGLDLERLVLSAGPLGLMQASLDNVLPYTHQRKQFGQPIAHNQLIHGKLADMYTKYRASQSFTYSVARAVDESHASPNIKTQDCAGAILYAAERASEVAADAIQLMGGMGYMNEVPVGRILRDAKLYEIGAGTSEVRRMVIGRAFNKEYKQEI
ncbi:Intradiol ring-cleavage dioxygenase [Bipolaris maydis]|uniref:Intradiol ring-cleavage dioxygenase n=1 Tax=Cochliobolus heterostrophus TaxID=5016 RepID=UPI0024D8CA78|nr:Intradiol ring-cleavage dioxygenase [Bipolaris maydis]KAJ6275758.1 Intradiol ring-cleavage dioxygenase [Bipolaris maydis]KAJ6286908.1 Intradiol ring-cleavage dioxygenase [Bipolaris maydis]